MANEAVKVENSGNYEQHDFTVSDVAGIEKYTICKLSDPRTAAATSGSGDVFAGIAGAEKVANDGSTNLSLYTRGIFKLTCVSGGAITAGELVATSGANLIRTAVAAEADTGKVIGKALETMEAQGTGEVFVGQF